VWCDEDQDSAFTRKNSLTTEQFFDEDLARVFHCVCLSSSSSYITWSINDVYLHGTWAYNQASRRRECELSTVGYPIVFELRCLRLQKQHKHNITCLGYNVIVACMPVCMHNVCTLQFTIQSKDVICKPSKKTSIPFHTGTEEPLSGSWGMQKSSQVLERMERELRRIKEADNVHLYLIYAYNNINTN